MTTATPSLLVFAGSTRAQSFNRRLAHVAADIARAQAELGWEPRVQLDAGLEKTIHYFKQFLQS